MARLGRRSERQTRKPRRWPKVLWRVLRWPVRFCTGLLIFALLWVWSYRVIDPPGGIYMASEAWRLGHIDQEWRDLDQISPQLARTVIAAEDARFCTHNGFDFSAIQAALKANEQGKRLRGGSTITQQVAKNVFLWHERSWVRKGLEAGFTLLIEVLWPKRRILEVYVNMAEFAPGVFGAEAAARWHFDRSAASLSLRQAALLAATLPGPKTRSARKPSAFMRKRAHAIADGAEKLRQNGQASCVS